MCLLLVGNYGVGNLGDEALKEYFLTRFPDIDWQVISAHPVEGELPRLPLGLRSLLSMRWLKTISTYRRSEGIVFGGGSLFTDIESVRACFLWGLHALPAMLFGKKIFLAFQGVGPFRTGVGEWCARFVARRAAFISIRDRQSLDRVSQWGLNTKIVQTFDPVFSLIHAEKHDVRSKNILIIIPRKNSGISLLNKARSLVNRGGWEGIRILSMEPDDPLEKAMVSRLAQEFSASVIPVRTLTELCDQIGEAGMVLSERYHGGLAAMALGIPLEMVTQGTGDKLQTLRDIGAVDLRELAQKVEDGRIALQNEIV